MVEIGARYAPWALRAVRAAMTLKRSSRFHVVAVEPSGRHVGWIREHFRMNGMEPSGGKFKLDIVQNTFCNRNSSNGKAQYTECTASILANVDHVDFLDIAAQGAEELMLRSPADRHAFRTKVKRVHIETHSDTVWKEVADALLRLRFKITQNATWMYSAYHSETFGPNWWRGGGLYAINPELQVLC